MFERFTERARQVIVLAQQSSREFLHEDIDANHLLVGLLAEQEGLAAAVLDKLGIDMAWVETEIMRSRGKGDKQIDGQIPFTPDCKKVLEFALREALSIGHNYVGTEHILLGMVRDGRNAGADILRAHDVADHQVRNEIMRVLRPESHLDDLGKSIPIQASVSPVRRRRPDRQSQAVTLYLPPGMPTNIVNCARCQKNHSCVEFYRFTREVVLDELWGFTHWGLCPETHEPILLRVLPSR